MRGCFVTGTDTGVGKTQVTAGLAAALQDAVRASVWKPVQTGVAVGDEEADSHVLKKVAGLTVSEQELVSVTLPDPLAPWMAAERAKTMIEYDDLIRSGKRKLAASDYLLVEGAGGLAVPLTSCHLMSDLARDLGLAVLIVARAGLGTVNHTLLSVSYARKSGLSVLGVILNGYPDQADPALHENKRMIEHFGGVEVIGMLPWLPQPAANADFEHWRKSWVKIIGNKVDLSKLGIL